ncbi:sigma factor-like helix-turn-helix DNA-binding protein [Streptosporangium canum]|uniref:RNA polymerase sigma factor n=1 Tax=Streptosporangium canum TaxID=324952 RepID=UPI00379F63A9
MNDSVLVEALRARDAGALTALYDLHAEGLYRYCWFMLGGPDGAQVALRDTLIAAEAHVHALADPGRLVAWLYALARGECVRRRPAAAPEPAPADAGPVLAENGDADLRVMARNATRSLSPEEREVLELVSRHGLSVADLAAVLGVSARLAGRMYGSARERLRDLVTVEVLARKGPHDCASRARLSAGFTGELTPGTRERMIRHVSRCDTCAPHRAGQVSAAKVFGLLPGVTLPQTLRVRVMSGFADPDLVPYRRYVARRTGILDAAGFPVERARGNRRRSRATVAATAAVAAMTAMALIFIQSVVTSGEPPAGTAPGASPTTGEPPTGEPPGVRLPRSSEPGDASTALEALREGASAYPIGPAPPIGSIGPALPIAVTRPEPMPDRHVRGPFPAPTSTGEPPDRPGGPTASPTGPSSPQEPAPVLPGPPRPGARERPGPPRDHQGSRPPRRCRATPGPAPTTPRPVPTHAEPSPAPRPAPPTTARPAPAAPKPDPATAKPASAPPRPASTPPRPAPPTTARPAPTAPEPDPAAPPAGQPPATSADSPAQPVDLPASTERPAAESAGRPSGAPPGPATA